ncbi:Hypothetical predicted protein [Pelobates cultripes]|uniref:Uncharacterized protein n=1 Tax=Pelobates cultripes TaxID=61616 RepID=A0AAD1TES2_PELCU|nr:Hypothetical predicted protein [Pelobates cultripes]
MSGFFSTPSKDIQERKSDNEINPVNILNINMDPSMTQESSPVPETMKEILQDQLKSLLEAQFNMLKQDMLKSLEDIKQDTNRIAISVQAMEKKLVLFDNQLGTVNETVQSLTNKTLILEHKIAALEDRSRQFNLRLRGIPEEITTEKLKDYLCSLFKEVSPETTDYQIEKFHRIRKPNIRAGLR